MNISEIDSLFLEIKDYEKIYQFVDEYKSLNYLEFDNYSVDKLNLFVVDENFDFNKLEEAIDKIIETIPYIKKIFAKPIIHLIDQDNILPVEAVRKISNDTINHISFHSELWDNITDGEISPRKLLTRNNIDNYSIYENIAFAHLVNLILSFSKRYMRFLKDLIYNGNSKNLNYLERIDHIKYYLSLGKLHTGYMRNYEKIYPVIDRCVNKLNYIYTTVFSRLMRPVYKLNEKKSRDNFVLKRTNILKMHKDYHHIYLLLKYFESNNNITEEKIVEETDLDTVQKSYFYFVELLSIFAIINFNFQCNKEEHFVFDSLCADFKADAFLLNVRKESSGEVDYLRFNISKEKTYSFAIIPCSNPNKAASYISMVKGGSGIDEVILSTCIEDVEDTLFLSINNLESFRRIQQQIIKGMVYSDISFDTCHFCLGKMVKVETNDNKTRYECPSCRNVVEKVICNECGEEFYATLIKDFKNYFDENRRLNDLNSWLVNRDIEGLMHYRNITRIDKEMDVVCPCCKKVQRSR